MQSLDATKLKTISHLVDTILVLQQTGGTRPLEMMGGVINQIACQPIEKILAIDKTVCDIRDTVKAIDKLIACLPPGMLKDLNLKDLAGEIKGIAGKSK